MISFNLNFVWSLRPEILTDLIELHSLIFKVTQDYIAIFSKTQVENRLVKSIKVFPANMKSKNPMQKYPHIIELFDSILNMFVFIFLCPINFFTFFRNMFNSKQSKQSKAIHCVPTPPCSSRLINMLHPLLF